jgi:hypothetical protein
VYFVLLSSIANVQLSAGQEEFAKVNFVLKHDVGRTPWGVVAGPWKCGRLAHIFPRRLAAFFSASLQADISRLRCIDQGQGLDC